MATNYHSDLPNDQIHNPKDFDPAHKNSVLIKTGAGALNWKPSTYTLSSTVTCIDDVGGTLNNSYWILYSSDNTTTYHVWHNVSSAGDYFTTDAVQIQISITASDTAATIANATATALNALSGVTASAAAGVVSITTITNATKPLDGANTGFGFLSTETYTGTEYLQTDSYGNIKWGAGGGGGGCSNVFSTITTSPVSETVSASGCTDNLVLSQMNNTRITANASADTVQIEAIENITFRGDTTSGLEAGTEYVFDNSNTRGNRFLVGMGAGNSLTPAALLKAGIAIPNAGGKVVSYSGFGSANGTGEFYISLWKFTNDCGVSPETNPQGTLVGTVKVATAGNENTQCWTATITSLTYGGNDILVPSFRWTESTLSSARVVGKIRMY